jgi:hypothetical protein
MIGQTKEIPVKSYRHHLSRDNIVSKIFAPEQNQTISVNDRVELAKSVKSNGDFLDPGISGRVVADFRPVFSVLFDGQGTRHTVNSRFLTRLSKT